MQAHANLGRNVIERPTYIATLAQYKDKDLIKVITGLRRAGKSTLLELYKQSLIASGVNGDRIISINFEDPKNEHLVTSAALYEYITDLTQKNDKAVKSSKPTNAAQSQKTYVFLDEIQQVQSFEKAVDGLYLNKNLDIYITGSNAYFLSGELATLLSGRYIEIKVYPLSFKEYVSARTYESKSMGALFQQYIKYGGLPYMLAMEHDPQVAFDYLGGVYNTVVRKDVLARLIASNSLALDEVSRFLFDNVGNFTSIKKISDSLSSAGITITAPTVSRYVQALTEAYVLHKSMRYDLKGRHYLQTNSKFYLGDLGLRYYLLGDRPGDIGHLLENVVYLELCRRNHNVATGKSYTREIDFVATSSKGVSYYQVSASVLDSKTLERELEPLKAISDNHPKYLLTLDEVGNGSHDGIVQINVLDWLLEE